LPLHAKEPDSEGVNIRQSIFRNLVSADQVESRATLKYTQMTRQASQQGKLLPDNHPGPPAMQDCRRSVAVYVEVQRAAKDRKWEINVFDSPQVNAFRMPGGKIVLDDADQQQRPDAEHVGKTAPV
jgi:Zn-dependent protease with chaperone function